MTTEAYCLRERLRQASPELDADLELQWRIARSEWLPTIATKKGSVNSEPHVRGIEQHLDNVLTALQAHDPGASLLAMRPIELYLVLASALFHDIGEARSGGHHALLGHDIIRDEYTSLGLRNHQIARCLANICACHDGEAGFDRRGRIEDTLGDAVIAPHGLVRGRTIASLLVLGDRMDGAHTRTPPRYLSTMGKPRESEVVGRFRIIVRGVHADPAAYLVRTVLVPKPARKGGARPSKTTTRFRLNPEKSDAWRELWSSQGLTRRQVARALSVAERKVFSAGLDRTQIATLAGRPPRRRQRSNRYGDLLNPFGLPERWLADDMLLIEEGQEGQSEGFPWETLAAVVLKDVRKNREALHDVREHLAAAGLPLATWLVEHKERLHDDGGRQTYEPLFHKQYLVEVAEAMWELSVRVVGCAEFSYAELASQVGDRDISKVRTAARRLAIAARGMEVPKGMPWSSPVWAGDETWRWRVASECSSDNDAGWPAPGCKFVTLKGLKDVIRDELSEPERAAGR